MSNDASMKEARIRGYGPGLHVVRGARCRAGPRPFVAHARAWRASARARQGQAATMTATAMPEAIKVESRDRAGLWSAPGETPKYLTSKETIQSIDQSLNDVGLHLSRLQRERLEYRPLIPDILTGDAGGVVRIGFRRGCPLSGNTHLHALILPPARSLRLLPAANARQARTGSRSTSSGRPVPITTPSRASSQTFAPATFACCAWSRGRMERAAPGSPCASGWCCLAGRPPGGTTSSPAFSTTWRSGTRAACCWASRTAPRG